MCAAVKRGYAPTDPKEFDGKFGDTLRKAGRDLAYLLNQGYHIRYESNAWME